MTRIDITDQAFDVLSARMVELGAHEGCSYVLECLMICQGDDSSWASVSTYMPHDMAHALADTCCELGEYELALAILLQAKRGEAVGSASSLRSANRIANMQQRLAEVVLCQK